MPVPFSPLRVAPPRAVPRVTVRAGVGVSGLEAGEEQRLLERALVGTPEDVRRLCAYLVPVIQARVARALVASGHGGRHRNLREEVEDLTQDVFTLLFEHDARVLRAWSADRGLSLRNFVGMVARRKTNAVLSVRKRNPWYEEPMEDAAVERALPEAASSERQLAARQLLGEAMRRAAEEQSERGRVLLELMFKDGLDNPELVKRTGLKDTAVYQWRSRLTRTVRRHLEALSGEGGGGSHEA